MRSFTVDFSVAHMLENSLAKLKTVYSIDRVSAALVDEHKLVLSYVYPEHDIYLEKTRFSRRRTRSIIRSLQQDNTLFTTKMETMLFLRKRASDI